MERTDSAKRQSLVVDDNVHVNFHGRRDYGSATVYVPRHDGQYLYREFGSDNFSRYVYGERFGSDCACWWYSNYSSGG